jgi:hypothetical protein
MKTAIVFIQIGNPLPKYACENIKRTTQLFAREQFFLVVDETVSKGVPEELRKIQNLTIFISQIGKNAIGTTVSPKDFRQGFWQYTKLRLCTLRELHREYSQVSLLHIENDVLLLPDFLTFPFNSIQITSWLSHTEHDDSGAILFSPSSASTDNFVNRFIAEIASEGANSDMRILNRMRETFPLEFGLLPTLDSSVLDEREVLSNKHSINEDVGFDPAFLGIWLFGDDARNRFGLSKRFTVLGRGKVILPELLNFVQQENGLLINQSKRRTKVLSLHVHCKKTEVFSTLWASQIEKAILASRSGKPAWNFSFKIFLEVLSDYKRRGKLHTLLISLPMFGRIINRIRTSVS